MDFVYDEKNRVNMRIALMVLAIGNYGAKGYYNLQEVGLAKALDSIFDEVLIYKCVDSKEEESVEKIDECRNTTLHFCPVRRIGGNGNPDLRKIDSSIDVLICFSDTQLFFTRVYKWCKKNKIKLFPYIGVSESHSDNIFKKNVMDGMFQRNLHLYRSKICFAKTPTVAEKLRERKVNNVQLAPIGIDLELLNTEYELTSMPELKEKYGLRKEDKVVLFIGRLVEEKQPERMMDIFKKIWEKDRDWRLLMVGRGELSEKVDLMIRENGMNNIVCRIEQIPNKDIWELYRIADCFVNLNQQEIYGMALLEAMYYGCKVIAWHAPGPDYIIEDGVTGYLADSDEQVCQLILHSESVSENSKKAICEKFLWSGTAEIIRKVVCEEVLC